MKTIEDSRYLILRRFLSRSTDNLDIWLNIYQRNQPKEFRKFARISPPTFNALVRYLESQDVFHNNSSSGQEQMTVDRQIRLIFL